MVNYRKYNEEIKSIAEKLGDYEWLDFIACAVHKIRTGNECYRTERDYCEECKSRALAWLFLDNDIEVVRCGDCSNREGCRIYDNSNFNSNSYCEYGSKG